jgi:putative sugar O-methyltransferase
VPFDGQKLTASGFRHAYYASEFSRAIDFDHKDDLVICELGGGYANLPRILKQVHSARSFTYVILDLPQMLPVAAYFLNANCPDARIGLWDDLRDGPLSRSQLRTYDFVLLPNWDIERLPDGSVDAVINTASLAEMDRDIVENYLGQIRRITARGGHFYTVNRHHGVDYPELGGTRETGMDGWNLEWPGWRKKLDRPSWGDLHWGAWEQMDYKEVVLHRGE